jgi:hypothetical protein
MKAVIITLALAGLASTAPVNAQVLSTRLPAPTTTRGTSIDGSWQVVGRDGNGNTIYERRTSDRNGNILVQRARRDANGNMSIISSRTVSNTNNSNGAGIDGSWQVVGRDGNGNTIYERRARDRNGNIVVQRARRDANGNMSIISSRTVSNTSNRNGGNCDYNQTTNTLGDLIFGRSNDVSCDDVGNRVDGGWYQVGRGRDNNSIYERRTRDSNGNLVIQRARRNSNGTFTILSTRRASDNDRQWRKAQKQQDKEWRKDEKRENKKSQRGHDDNDDDRRSSRGDHR